MHSLSTTTKLVLTTIALVGVAVLWYQPWTRASTEVGITLTTNESLNQGLILHYTFDGADVDWSSNTAEVRDRSSGARHGDALSPMSASTSVSTGVLG